MQRPYEASDPHPVRKLANARTPISRVLRLLADHPQEVLLLYREGCRWQALLQLPEVIGHHGINWVRRDAGGLHFRPPP